MSESYHHGNLRQELINGGIKMLNRDGVAAFSLRKLSQELGVSHTAAYRHFASKEDLFRAIFEEVSKNFRDALAHSVATRDRDKGGSGDDRQSALRRLGIGYVLFFRDHPEYVPLFSLMHSENPFLDEIIPEKARDTGMPGQSGDSPMGRDQDEAFALFSGLVGSMRAEEAFKDLEEYEILLGFWAKVHGLSLLIVAHPDMIPPDRFEESVVRILDTRF